MAPTKGSNSGTGRSSEVDRMTDEEAAEFHYAHRDDQADAVTSVELETPRWLSRVISVRFDPEEAAAVERSARSAGLIMSAHVRQAALGQDRA